MSSTTFQDIFAIDQQNLEQALAANILEQNHLKRCMELVEMLRWPSNHLNNDGLNNDGRYRNNIDNEFGRLLGCEGVALFDSILQRIVRATAKHSNPQLQDPRLFLTYAIFVHDLGKYDALLNNYNGTEHEERSAQIVERQRERLTQLLSWHEESIDILVALARFHAFLGIVHLGGASMVYLAPLLDWLTQQKHMSARLFLDLLIALNCCDAGASGNFETRSFYLNSARLTNYIDAANTLIHAIHDLNSQTSVDSEVVLASHSIEMDSMVRRIQRIVSSNNFLSVSPSMAKQALDDVIESGYLNPCGFALTRFDHGAYVFEPLLRRMNPSARTVNSDSITNLLLFIGLMSRKVDSLTVLSFRDTFSMKPDLQPQNQLRFNALLSAVSSGQPDSMQRLVDSAMLRSQ